MLSSITYGKYIKGNLELHKLNPIYKILSFILMIFVCFFINSLVDVIIIFGYLLLVIAYSDIDMKIYLKELSIIKFILLFILAVDVITLSYPAVILCDLLRVVFIFTYFSLLMKSTTFNEIIYGIENITKPFSKINSGAILNISLILKFPYVFLREKEKYYVIEEKRNIKEVEGIKDKVIKYNNDLVKIFNLSLRILNKEEDNLKIKLYGYGKSRTNCRLDKFDKKEIIFIVLNVLVMLIVLFYK